MANGNPIFAIRLDPVLRKHLMKGARDRGQALAAFMKDAAKAETDRILAAKAARQAQQ